MWVPLRGRAAPSFSGWTLVVPAVSVGNAGQIALDLLISGSGVEKLGYWHCRHVIPAVGNDALAVRPAAARGAVALPVEVFGCAKRRVAVLQQRAPCARGSNRAFAEGIAAWAQKAGFARLIVAASCHAYKSESGVTDRFWFARVGSTAATEPAAKLFAEIKIKERAFDAKAAPAADGAEPGALDLLRQHTGATRFFLEAGAGATGLPTVALVAQVNEGDNMADGVAMAGLMNAVVSRVSDQPPLLDPKKKVTAPFAFQYAYGPKPDRRLYV